MVKEVTLIPKEGNIWQNLWEFFKNLGDRRINNSWIFIHEKLMDRLKVEFINIETYDWYFNIYGMLDDHSIVTIICSSSREGTWKEIVQLISLEVDSCPGIDDPDEIFFIALEE